MPDIAIPDLIRQEATKQGIPPELALAVAQQESSFNPTAIGPKLPSGEQAQGTFQILPSTAKGLGIDPTDPRQNIQGGVKYLRQLMDQHHGDLDQVLASYGGVKTDTTYVPQVRARIAQFQQAAPAATPAPIAAPSAVAAPPAPRNYQRLVSAKTGASQTTDANAPTGPGDFGGLDPRTPEGQRNWAGGIGAAALTAAAPELPVLGGLMKLAPRLAPFLTSMAGAYGGGATAKAGQDVASGTMPSMASSNEAGLEQAKNEAVGHAVSWPFRAAGRAVMAKKVGRDISTGLADALEATKSRLTQGQGVPKISPSQAGTLVHDVAFDGGPAATVKDQLGEAVGAAAKAGPDLPTAPLKARLADLATQITPMASHEGSVPADMISGRQMSSAQLTEMATKHPELGLSIIPPDHPLPGVLSQIQSALGDSDTIPFEDAHKIKRLLDDTVNWDSPAKKQVQQITKGFRQTLREQMASHAPYNQATEDYAKVAQLYTKPVQTLHREILTNPEGLVEKVDWKHPSQAKLLKDLTVEVPKQAGDEGAQQGEAAWNGVRAAYTRDKLIAKGPAAMNAEIAKMKATGNGQEFLQTMYGDQQGTTVLKNLEQLGQAWQDAATNADKFNQTGLAHAQGPAQAVGDVLSVTMHGHPIMGLRAGARLVMGPHAKEMIEWASRSPTRTQFVINHVLAAPDPGMAAADFYRWMQSSQDSGSEPDAPMPSHEITPPPAPRMTRTGAPPVPSSR